MLFLVRAVVDRSTKAKLQPLIERRLHFVVHRFGGSIHEICVALRDVNGPRGGIDKQCKIVARSRRGDTLEIEETRSSFSEAIGGSAKRLRNVLARRIGGKRHSKTLRHTYRSPIYSDADGDL